MLNVMDTPKRILISLFFIIAVAAIGFTISYVNANQGGGYAEDVNPDGTGWKVRWLYNMEGTVSGTTAISKSTLPGRLRVSCTTSVYASREDSTGVQNEGDYRMGNWFHHVDGDYEGNLSEGLSDTGTYWFHSPNDLYFICYARVYPDRDGDVDVNLQF